MSENIFLSSQTIDLAENEDYLLLTNRLCYYVYPNLNKVALPFDDTTLEKAKTLINMPVQAKYATNFNGEPTFKGHEAYRDKKGNVQLLTDSIGTHIDVYIKEDSVDVNGEIKTLPCLFATYRIWKRNLNVVNAVRRLFSEGKLYSSWEIRTISYEYKNGIKNLSDYVFLGNCLLGYEYSSPAYGTDSKAIQMSQDESILLVAEAFSKDILENSVSDIKEIKKEDKVLEENVIIPVEAPIETPVENTEIVVEPEVTEPVKVEGNDIEVLTSQLEIKTKEVEGLNTTISELNTKVETLTSSLVEASGKIQGLTVIVSELTPYKLSAEKAEQERIELETSEKRGAMKKFAMDSKFITEDELSSVEEIKNAIDNVDEKSLKVIIAERFMKTLEVTDSKSIETSTIKVEKEETPKASIIDSVETEVSSKSIMKKFLR